MIANLTDVEIDQVNGGLTIDSGWKVVDPAMWAQYYGALEYPSTPPKYRDSTDPSEWVY